MKSKNKYLISLSDRTCALTTYYTAVTHSYICMTCKNIFLISLSDRTCALTTYYTAVTHSYICMTCKNIFLISWFMVWSIVLAYFLPMTAMLPIRAYVSAVRIYPLFYGLIDHTRVFFTHYSAVTRIRSYISPIKIDPLFHGFIDHGRVVFTHYSDVTHSYIRITCKKISLISWFDRSWPCTFWPLEWCYPFVRM